MFGRGISNFYDEVSYNLINGDKQFSSEIILNYKVSGTKATTLKLS